MTIGDRIRRVREQAGHTQVSLATAIGVHEQSVYRWENDRTPPRTSHLFAVIGVCGVTIQEFWAQSANDND